MTLRNTVVSVPKKKQVVNAAVAAVLFAILI